MSNIGKVPKLTGARKVTSSTKKKFPPTAIDNVKNTIENTLKNTYNATIPEEISSILCSLVKSSVAEVLHITIRATHISLLQSPEKCNTNHMKEKIRPQHIYNDQYANPSIDGTFIECSICKGKGQVREKNVMRRPFQTINWDSAHGHVNTKGYIISMGIVEAKKKPKLIGNKKSTNMLNFFKVAKSKKEFVNLDTSQALCVYVEKTSKVQVDLITKKV